MSNDSVGTSNFESHGITAEQSRETAYGSQRSGTVETNATQSDRSGHTVPDIPSTLPLRGNLPPPTHEDLDRIVEDCRRGRSTKSSATKDLLESVERLTDLPAETREKTFVSFLTEINSIDRETVERGPVAGLAPGQSSGQTREGIRRVDESEDQELPPIQEETITDRIVRNLAKRPVAQENAEDGNPGSKRPKLGQSDMPWFGSTRGNGHTNHVLSCTRTCELLELYGEDLARSKFLIRTALYSPEGIPASQWERILRGETLNLDHFLSSIVRTQVDEDRKARLGETHLTFSTSEAKRKVRNSSDWASAWRRASEAVIFAFPHRREELDQYQKHIQVEFDARQSHAHQRVIAYDIAVRNFVGGGQTSLLTDREKFSHLYAAIVLPDGIEFTSSYPSNSVRRAAPVRTSKGVETCNKFNTYSGCNHDPCKYKHVCKKCGGDHPQNEHDSQK